MIKPWKPPKIKPVVAIFLLLALSIGIIFYGFTTADTRTIEIMGIELTHRNITEFGLVVGVLEVLLALSAISLEDHKQVHRIIVGIGILLYFGGFSASSALRDYGDTRRTTGQALFSGGALLPLLLFISYLRYRAWRQKTTYIDKIPKE